MQTRRSFIVAVGAAGGYSAAFIAMQALGLLPAAASQPLTLQRGVKHGTRVVILGAGIAGLSAAYELREAGYDCTLIEARARSGGRNWTIRRGTELLMLDATHQRCEFSPGLYWNAGAARIPSQHRMILDYCRVFGVPLEVEVNSTRAAELTNPQVFAGRPIQLRQAVNDTRGAVSELLAKAVGRGALDQELTVHDKERVLSFLRQYGDLNPDLLYKGSSRSGYKTPPGPASQAGVLQDPLSLDVLLDDDLWNGVLFEDLITQQATMFQPVGGMDRIPAAFEIRLDGVLRHNCEVASIRRRQTGVRIEYRDLHTGQEGAVDAEYCICTIPAAVVSKIPSDFSTPYKAALANIQSEESVKIAWQARRFWERDFGIYGGISWVHGLTSMVWYPSGELFADEGILIGAYTSGDLGALLSSKPLHEQFDLSRQTIERLHSGFGRELTKPMAIAWSKVRYSLGEGVSYRDGRGDEYQLLNRPDGPFYFAGDYLSQIGTWQESAICSSRYTINKLDEHRRIHSQRTPSDLTSSRP